MTSLLIVVGVTLVGLVTGRIATTRAQTVEALFEAGIATVLIALALVAFGRSLLQDSREQHAWLGRPILSSAEQLNPSPFDDVLFIGGYTYDPTLPSPQIDVGEQRLVVLGDEYERIGWGEEGGTGFLKEGDTVVVRGALGASDMFLGLDEDDMVVSADFVFRGDVEAYSAEYKPVLERRADLTYIAGTVSFVSAALVTILPLLQFGAKMAR